MSKAYHYTPDDGKVVGQHQGAHYFTIGQRKGLGVGGTPEPLFIIDTDTKNNIVYTGQGDRHNGLYRKGLYVRNKISTGSGMTFDYIQILKCAARLGSDIDRILRMRLYIRDAMAYTSYLTSYKEE